MPLTDLTLVTPANLPRPAYLIPVNEPGYGTQLTRITGDTGSPMAGGCAGAKFHIGSRHHYSRDDAWNFDMTLVKLDQPKVQGASGTPSKFILDARTWVPVLGNRGTARVSKLLDQCTETRWLPGHPSRLVGIISGTTVEVVVFDVLTDQVFKRIRVNAAVGLMSEGKLSRDGSVLALGNKSNEAVLVDILNGRVGPVHKVGFVFPDAHGMDNLCVSRLSTAERGKLVIKAGSTPEYHRVYDFGPDLTLKPHPMYPWGLRMKMSKVPEGGEAGLIACGSHADAAVTPDGRDVWVMGVRDYGMDVNLKGTSLPPGVKAFDKKDGVVIAVDLDTGIHFHVSPGANVNGGEKEASDQHCTGCTPDGWAGITYAGKQETSGRFVGELMLVKLDGSRECVRFGNTRTNEAAPVNTDDQYRCEAHGVWRPDGKAVMFASNFQHETPAPFVPNYDVKAFVLSLPSVLPPPQGRYGLEDGWTYTPAQGVLDRTTGRIITLPDVVRLLNQKP